MCEAGTQGYILFNTIKPISPDRYKLRGLLRQLDDTRVQADTIVLSL